MFSTQPRSLNATSQPVLPCQNVTLTASTTLCAGDWVDLWVLPSEFAHDMALLLCETDVDHWMAWIPDYGAIELCLRQICAVA